MSETAENFGTGEPGTPVNPAAPVKKRGGFPFRKKVVEPEPETQEAREAREAAERAVAAEAVRLAEIGAAWAQLGERVRAALPTSEDYRQIYLLSLLRQGREAEEAGRAKVAGHCRACIVSALDARAARTPASVSSAPAPVATTGKPAAPQTALTRLKDRWEAAARDRAAALLARHAKRLAPAEREAYVASLDSLSAAPNAGARPLRRKLVDRLLRAASTRRRASRLSGWKSAPGPVNGPAGPYNDFVALEQTIQRIAQIHPEWAVEFSDLYGDMLKIRTAYQGLLPASKK